MHRYAWLALALAITPPAAAGPITVTVGAGVRLQRTARSMDTNAYGFDRDGHSAVGPALSLALGYQLPLTTSYQVAVGLRAAFGQMSLVDRQYGSMATEWADVTRRYPLDLAATAQITSGRWWATPWIGMQQTRVTKTRYDVDSGESIPWSGGRELSSKTDRDLAAGVTVGYDLFHTRGGSVGLTVDGEVTGAYAAIGLGVAYHL